MHNLDKPVRKVKIGFYRPLTSYAYLTSLNIIKAINTPQNIIMTITKTKII